MTTTELPVATISAPAEVLRSVLRGALVAADEYNHPGLMGVLLHGDTHARADPPPGTRPPPKARVPAHRRRRSRHRRHHNGEPVLVATATDRYKIAKHLGCGSVRIGLSEPREPLAAYIGNMARVLVMPRFDHDKKVTSIPPVFDPFPDSGEPT